MTKRAVYALILMLSVCFLIGKCNLKAKEDTKETVDFITEKGKAVFATFILNNNSLMRINNFDATINPQTTKKASQKKKKKKIKNYVVKKSPGCSFKSYMDYHCITCHASRQYKIQRKSHTDKKTGIRLYKGRYCIALGSFYTKKIGVKIDLIMSSGKVVKCITADMKADCDTINLHRQHPDGSVVEFIVSTKKLPKKVKRMGDISYTGPFKGSIKKIKIYK